MKEVLNNLFGSYLVAFGLVVLAGLLILLLVILTNIPDMDKRPIDNNNSSFIMKCNYNVNDTYICKLRK